MARGGRREGAGRRRGTKNKATIERERAAMLAVERARLLQEARADTAKQEIAKAAAEGRQLMKEIGFEFAQMFAGIAGFYQPGRIVPGPDGKPVPSNPYYDERLFREYATLAVHTARDFAGYESPKLSAVVVGSAVVNEIEVIGGLPDEQDGGLADAAEVAPQHTGGSICGPPK
jgi:hypothetical protein